MYKPITHTITVAHIAAFFKRNLPTLKESTPLVTKNTCLYIAKLLALSRFVVFEDKFTYSTLAPIKTKQLK